MTNWIISLRRKVLPAFASGLVLIGLSLPVVGQVTPRTANGPRLLPQFGQRRAGGGPGINGQRPAARPGARVNQMRRQLLQKRLMQAIGLSPEQSQRIQRIRRDHEDERISAGRRIRQARQALDRTIMSEQYDAEAVRRATEELAQAQAERVRLESRIRGEIRAVLTPEQVTRFHQLERELRRGMRERLRQQDERDREQLR